MMKNNELKTVKYNGVRYRITRNNGVEVVLIPRRAKDDSKKITVAISDLSKRLRDRLKAGKNATDYHYVTNVMSGKRVKEDVATPYGCSVGDEAYWCN
jgi:gas vesicle protein